MAKWPWIDRKFSFDFPASKFPDLLERWRGTPARLEERVSGLSRDVLIRRVARVVPTWGLDSITRAGSWGRKRERKRRCDVATKRRRGA
ncbi:MAG: hypothetical protein IIC02_05390 [Planctomycetes bacterium]|nr:hypothetical protein [Planctomycetota bacterium]